MRIELYVLNNGKKYQLDLQRPTDITLEFKSNLLGDISKVTSSHSYSFNIPYTVKNKNILDMIDDARHESSFFGKKISCECRLDGMPFFDNGYLYVSAVTEGYSAVMTWDVCHGLETIYNDDISLQELTEELDGQVRLLGYDTNGYNVLHDTTFDNTQGFVRPEYTTNAIGNRYPELPCIPVYRVLRAIEQHYDMKIDLGTPVTTSDLSFNSQTDSTIEPQMLVNEGVLPLVSRSATKTIADATYQAEAITFISDKTTILDNIVGLFESEGLRTGTNAYGRNRVLYWDEEDDEWDKNRRLVNFLDDGHTCEQYEATGYYVKCKTKRCKLEVTFRITKAMGSSNSTSEESVTSSPIYVYRYKTQRSSSFGSSTQARIIPSYWELIDKIDGSMEKEYDALYEFYYLIFNGNIEIEDFEEGDILIMTYDGEEFGAFSVDEYPKITIEPDPKYGDYLLDVCKNLPDISCLTFVKSLFYAMGGFPQITRDGNISLVYFNDLKKNIIDGNVYDWSKKITTSDFALPELELTFDGIAQKSYYLMKNESETKSKDTDKDSEKWKEIGYCLECNNSVIDRTSTIFQFPYYPSYLGTSDAKSSVECVKQWKVELNDDWFFGSRESRYKVTDCDGVPTFGIVASLNPYGNTSLYFVLWDISKTKGCYQFIYDALKYPYVIKEKMNLNVLDIINLDYSKPVYINKYNAYFAIQKITYNDSQSEVTLVKLPSVNRQQ